MNNNDIKSPIEPYFPEYGISEYEENVFVKEGRPLTNDEMNIFIKQLISPKNFLNEEKSPILKKIWDDAKHVNSLLDELNVMGFEYTLDLSGGSVRDFILNRHNEIKDLDFMLKIESHKEGSVNKIIKHFTEEERKNVGFNFLPTDDIAINKDEILLKLLELCLNRKSENIEVNKNNERTYKVFKTYAIDHYANQSVFETHKKDRLSGVVKISDEKTNYPVDILLTDFPKPEFINDFDYDLCKISFSLVNPYYTKKFPTNYSHLISRVVSTPGFWADWKNQKLTINIDDLASWQIDRSINNHLDRLQQKYEGFELNVTGNQPIQRKQLETILIARELKENLESKVEANISTQKRNKI